MWKAEGDVEMVSTSDTYDDEDDGVGYTMRGNGINPKSMGHHGQHKQLARRLCCGGCLLFTVVGCVLAYVYVPSFGLLTTSIFGEATGSNSNDGTPAEVNPDSIVDNDSYEVILKVPVPTVEGDLVLYQHKTTKTPIMTILPYDTHQDSVFGIGFRTKPSNSHGAPHVLEHSVLAGSKKYPIKDPFTQVLKGSLNTYVNAMTWDDLTAYVCASRNDVDMKNLMDVYMDAVFAPLVITDAGNWIFRQEGWRVEMNETGEPEFNGVVLSEMKGAMSDPDELFSEYAATQMFPNTPYKYNSGGEPSVIPNLSHEELQQFYQTFYHPSNAQVFLYGTKASAENCLTNLDEYLSTYEPKPEIRQQSTIELQPLLEIDPAIQRIPYSSTDAEASHQFLMSWMISKDGSMDDDYHNDNRVAYMVLEQLLLNDKTGVLYRALQDSGLVGSIDGGVELGMRQWSLDVQANNVNATNIDQVRDLIVSTLKKAADKGFAKEDIAAAMNTVQFNNRDISSDSSTPRGISLWLKVMDTWKFDLAPLTGFLSFDEDFESLQQRLNERGGAKLFQNIITENVLNNKHAVVIDMYPDPKLSQKMASEEQERLVKLRKSQTFPGLLDEADAMSEKQVTEDPPELIAKIPSITVADLDKKGYEPPVLIDEDRDGSGVTVLLHEVESSFGILYADLGVDISMLEFDDLVLMPLLARLMVDAGTEKYTDVQIARVVGSNTGGVGEEIVISPILPSNTTNHYRIPHGDHFYSKLFLRGAASKEKGDTLLELLSEMMFHAKLDSQERALGILREFISGMEQDLVSGGMSYARSRINARYKTYKFVDETLGGVSSLPKLRELLKSAENDWGGTLARLHKMYQAILKGNRRGMVLNLTGDEGVLKHCAQRVTHFLEHQLPERSQSTPLPNFEKEPHPWAEPAKKAMAEESPIHNEGVAIGAAVNFVGAGAPFYRAPEEEILGSSEVVTQYVEYNYFMAEIRERQGAYGAFARMDKWTGLLQFMTYRDPNLVETLTVYRETPKFLKDQMEDPEKAKALIDSAIIGTIGSLDGVAPQPDSAGWISLLQWYRGSTVKIRQAWREEILSTTSQDFLDYAERMESWKPTLGIAGPKSRLEREKGLDLTIIDYL